MQAMIGAKRLAEASLVTCGLDRWGLRRFRGRVLVLAYHNIIPDDDAAMGDRSLHLRRGRFADQLDVLQNVSDVIPLADALVERPRDARPAAAITFDDAYRGALTIGAAELQARRLPATMFAAPGLLSGDSFWWDALAATADLTTDVREYAMGELRGDSATVRAWAASTGRPWQEMPPWGRPGTESELAAWGAFDSLAVGVHTWRHANLSRLAGTELSDELGKPLEWLRKRLGAQVLPWLTYSSVRLCRRPPALTPQKSSATMRRSPCRAGGCCRQVTDPYLLPRLNIPAGLTTKGFRVRLAAIGGRPVAPPQHADAPARVYRA